MQKSKYRFVIVKEGKMKGKHGIVYSDADVIGKVIVYFTDENFTLLDGGQKSLISPDKLRFIGHKK